MAEISLKEDLQKDHSYLTSMAKLEDGNLEKSRLELLNLPARSLVTTTAVLNTQLATQFHFLLTRKTQTSRLCGGLCA